MYVNNLRLSGVKSYMGMLGMHESGSGNHRGKDIMIREATQSRVNLDSIIICPELLL